MSITADPPTKPSPSRGRPRLYLASRSPRRHALLHEAGIEHEVRLAEGLDDADLSPGEVTPECWVASLAYLKARAVADAMDPGDDAVVLGADTICVMGDEIIGQPTDRDDAGRIIRSFRLAEHEVLTGVAMVDREGHLRDLFIDRATVRVGDLPDDSIERYLDSGDWHGKAGAYNLFERLEAGWPIEYSGDGTTIVGLPMRALGDRLKAAGLSG